MRYYIYNDEEYNEEKENKKLKNFLTFSTPLFELINSEARRFKVNPAIIIRATTNFYKKHSVQSERRLREFALDDKFTKDLYVIYDGVETALFAYFREYTREIFISDFFREVRIIAEQQEFEELRERFKKSESKLEILAETYFKKAKKQSRALTLNIIKLIFIKCK